MNEAKKRKPMPKPSEIILFAGETVFHFHCIAIVV